ncbi:hypothetical protein ElyMa_006947000 [Elysia marginata]|uniref:Ig-like domain-containing protein n=1 Tax=Elysia marginata TaxID=1093978 RepID=A0AAV4JKL4_9GAST|nr:hypothetical protein ElyMa_006947000 [Elysia marginata]
MPQQTSTFEACSWVPILQMGGLGKVRVNCFPKAIATWYGRESNPRSPDLESDALITPPPCQAKTPPTLDIPEGRKWEFKFGINIFDLTQPFVYFVNWTIRDPKPEDAGLYECEVCFGKPRRCTLSNPEALRFQAEIRYVWLKVEPKRENNKYLEDDLILITCKAKVGYDWRIGSVALR